MCELLLDRRQAVHLVSTPYYNSFITYLLKYPTCASESVSLKQLDMETSTSGSKDKEGSASSRVDDIIHQLYESGLWAQAGSLLLASQGVHPLLRTMDSALTNLFGK